MKYVLPLSKEKEKYHFEISNDGREFKKNSIMPILNNDKQFENGAIYVESPFQNGKYFELTNFNEKSLDKWKEILKELASKIGATKIKTTLLFEKDNSKTTDNKNEAKLEMDGIYKVVEGELSVDKKTDFYENDNEILKSSLEFELELKGKKQPVEDVQKWIEDKNINLEDNFIFRSLFEQYQEDNLKSYKETRKVEQILTGLTKVNNTIEAIAKIKSPLLSTSFKTTLSDTRKEEFRKYEKKELIIEISF